MTLDLARAFRNAVLNIVDKEGQPATLGTAGGTVYYNDGANDHLNRVWVRMGAEKQVQVVAKVGKKGIPNMPGLEVNVSKRYGSLYVDDWPAFDGIGSETLPGTGISGHVHEYNTRNTIVDDSAGRLGTDNVIIGNTAGESMSISTAQNVIIGSAAGASAEANNSVLIGYNAGGGAAAAGGSESVDSFGSMTDIGDVDLYSLTGASSSSRGYRGMANLDGTKAVLVRVQYDSPYAIQYNVVSVSGDTITPGTWADIDGAVQREETPLYNISIAAINSSTVLVAWTYYSPAPDDDYGIRLRAGTIGGSTITWGSEVNYINAGAGLADVDVAVMSSSYAIVTYNDGNTIQARVVSISGTTLTLQTEYEVEGTNCSGNEVSVSALSSTVAIIAYRDSNGNDNVGQAKVATRAGSSLAFGSAYQFSGSGLYVRHIKCMALDSSSFVIGFKEHYTPGGASWANTHATVGTVSGNVITFGNSEALDLANTYTGELDFDVINATHFLVSRQLSSYDDEFAIGTISGTSISFSSIVENTGQSNDGLGFYIGVLSSSKALSIQYTDESGPPDRVGAYTVNFSGVAVAASYNTYVGANAGGSNTGDYGICLGADAGENNTNDYRLYIDISDTTTPLIYGEFDDDNLGVRTIDMAGGVGVIAIANATTAPAGTPTGGGVLYVEGGALKYKGSSGTVTTLGPA